MRRARWRRRPSPTEPNPTPEIPPLNPPMATYPSEGDARRKDAVARSRRRAIRAADRAQKDRWPSGLRHTLGKRAWCNSHRGFESRPVRQRVHVTFTRNTNIAKRPRKRGVWITLLSAQRATNTGLSGGPYAAGLQN